MDKLESKQLMDKMLNGELTRRDVYELRVKPNADERLQALAQDFEFAPPDRAKYEDEDGILNLRSYYREFKKEWLSRYIYYKDIYSVLVDEIEYTKQKGNKLVATLTGMPRGSHTSLPDDQWSDIIEFTDKAIDYLCTVSENMLYTLLEIEEAIKAIKVPEQQLVLSYRYIKGMSVNEIAKTISYSRSQVWKIEKRALDKLDINCTDVELKERMEREYRRLEFEQDHFDPEKVDPEVLAEYMDELLEDRSEAAKIIDRNQLSRAARKRKREKRKEMDLKKKQQEELEIRKNRRKTGVIRRDPNK